MTAKKKPIKGKIGLPVSTERSIEQYQRRADYLADALEGVTIAFKASKQNLKDAREGIRNLRFVVALLVAGWGLSVGVLLAVLR